MQGLTYKLFVALSISCISFNSQAAAGKDFGVIGGRIITCQEAVAYRDGNLFRELNVLIKDYDAGKAMRQNAVRAEFKKHIQAINAAWAQNGPAKRKAIAANGVALALSVAAQGTAKWVQSRPALSSIEKKAADELLNRSATLTGSVLQAGLTKTVSIQDLSLLPVNTIAAVVYPPAALALTVYGLGTGIIGTGDSLADYFLAKADYENESTALIKALQSLNERSADQQIMRLNQVKAEIDKACS